MKNTAETIALPDFAVDIIHNDNGTFIHDHIRLTDQIHDQQTGLILYFYPKDNTAGCSVQASDFTALASDFAKLGYTIIGVSRDSLKSHQNFITKKELDIALISDPNEQLCQHFDVIKEKMMYGKTHLGVVRSTFVFNKDGHMTASFRNIKAKDHANTLLDFLKTP